MVRTAMFCAVFLLVQVAFAQSSEIPEPEARQHVTHQANPVYPPIARAAQVQGQVVLAVVIDANGAVSSERVVSGPPMLQQAALDAVKNWEFSPFMANNAPISVATTLTLSFQIEQNGPAPNPEQQRAAQALFPLSDKCRSALRAGDTQNALDYCKQALDMSFKAGDLTSSDQLGRLDAHQLYGHALLLAGKLNEALEQENLAI